MWYWYFVHPCVWVVIHLSFIHPSLMNCSGCSGFTNKLKVEGWIVTVVSRSCRWLQYLSLSLCPRIHLSFTFIVRLFLSLFIPYQHFHPSVYSLKPFTFHRVEPHGHCPVTMLQHSSRTLALSLHLPQNPPSMSLQSSYLLPKRENPQRIQKTETRPHWDLLKISCF